ncbi:hypothetical protein PRUB_a0811 [Pseudoalteromonas rubra]|uniref:Uncharacterized protein n=1 Tax=Pseudoalteromonas rubra TaxID=43658 RepID=A0A8T0C8K0_9GAMM|nr:hypothetical protein [Pseudoalteromonas rubra]KAF7786295.1 hypothetical protein PRUB_a0811 [Pseudoalteromonas rubra]
MIHVIETWTLKEEFVDQALELMQQLDDQLGELAHDHSGWLDHAHFYQNSIQPTQIIMSYDWKSLESHENMTELESDIVSIFEEKYCAKPREMNRFHELDVDTDH